jgi:quercetin dioxygenase-like cupin family protein
LKRKWVFFAAFLVLPLRLCAQTTAAVPITSEPHHHLALTNSDVRVFQFDVPPHTSTLLHQHDYDYIYIIIGDAHITNLVTGKPPVVMTAVDGELHFARGGFSHVARNEAATPFRGVAVELLHPQGAVWNLCGADIVHGAPMKSTACPASGQTPAPGATPQFETEHTRVTRVNLAPHQPLNLSSGKPDPAVPGLEMDPQREYLLITLDRAVSAPLVGKGMERLLQPGDFLWLDGKMPARIYKNDSDQPARFVLIEFMP